VVLALIAPVPAGAQTSVTIAARACPSYESITANLARNDIQESLRDLGPDTLYSAGQPIDPDVEARGQSQCTPLPNWRFTLGTGYKTRAVTGSWGSLSIVTGAMSDSVVTQASIPLLNASGADTGRDLQGAVRIVLTQNQLNLAARTQLWIQGGTTTDPVLDGVYPQQYGFGALRCAIDDYNGDNVESIQFPTGARNVFCYAYYVTPPPTSGTIVMRKEVDAPAGTDANDFVFGGNLSFNATGEFDLNAAPGQPASQTFYRAAVPAGGTPWEVHEEVPPGWVLLSADCTSQTGASTTQVIFSAATVSVSLAAGDTVTCTYRDGLQPPPSGLVLGKVTRGAVGATRFHVTSESGQAQAFDARVETTTPDRPVYVTFPPLAAGDWEINETPEPLPGGDWVLAQVRCGGRIVPGAPDPMDVTIPAGSGRDCLYVNEFRPDGRIRVRKITEGGTGTTGFTIRPVNADPPVLYQQEATTTVEGRRVLATGDDTTGIPIGTYDIQESTTSNAGSGSWLLEAVTCDGVPVGSAQGRIRVTLTADDPTVDCTFTNVKRSGEGGGGGGGGNGVGGQSSSADPVTNVRVTKRVSPTDIVAGQAAHYTVVVSNTSNVTARDVVVNELQPPSHRFVNIIAPKGVRCRGTRPLRCVIGTLAPHRRLTLRATVRTSLRGRVVNRVAVHTSSRETRLSDNQARAVLNVHVVSPAACGARGRC
jgi:uncharacterized repeat protein (TIGR01451 family)